MDPWDGLEPTAAVPGIPMRLDLMTDSEPSGLGTATLSMGGGSLPPIALPPLSLPPLKTTEPHIGLSPMGGLSYPSPSLNQSLMGSPLMACGSSPMNVGPNATINSPMMYRPPQSPQNQANQYGGPGSAGSHMDGFVTSPGPPKAGGGQRKSRPRPRTVNRQLLDTIQTSPNSSNSVNVNSRQNKSVPVSPSSSNPPTPSSVPMMRYNSVDGGMGSPLGGSPSAAIMHSPASHQHNMVLNGQSPCQSPKPNGFHPGPNQGPPTTASNTGGQSVAHVSVHHVQSTGERVYQNELQQPQSNRNPSFLAQQLSKPTSARPPRPAQQSVLIEHKNLPPRDDPYMASTSRNGGPPGQLMQQSVSHVTVIPSPGHPSSLSHQERSTVGGRMRMQQHPEHSQSSQAIVQHLPLRVGSAGPATSSSASFQGRNLPYSPQQQSVSHAVIHHQQLPPIAQMNNSTMLNRAPNQQGPTSVHIQAAAMANNQQQQYHSQAGTSQDYSTSMHNIVVSSQSQIAQTAMYPVATVTNHPVSRTTTSRPRPPNQNNSEYANATITVSMQSNAMSAGAKNNRSRPPGQYMEDELLATADGTPKQEDPPIQEMKRELDQQMPPSRNTTGPLRMGQQQYYGESAASKNQTTMSANAAMTTAGRPGVRPKPMTAMNISQTNGSPMEVMQQRQALPVNRSQKPTMSSQSAQPALSQEQIKRILAQRRPSGILPTANINGQNGLSANGQQGGAQMQGGPPRLVHRIGSQGPPDQRMQAIPAQSHLRNMLGGAGTTIPGGQRLQNTQIVAGMGPPVMQRPPTQVVTPQVLQLAQSIDNQRQVNPSTNKDQFRSYKRKFKCLVYENECYQEELRNLQRKLLKLSRDKNFLLDRLMNYEKFSDSSDYESDASQQTVTDRPKTRKRVRASQSQRKRSTVSPSGSRVDESISGTPSPCPSPSPAMHSHYQLPGPSGMNKPQDTKFIKSSSVKNRRSSMPNQTPYAPEDAPGSSATMRNYISEAQHNAYNTATYHGEESSRMETMPNGLQTDYGSHYIGAQHAQEVSDGQVNGTCNQNSQRKEDYTDSDATDIGDVLE